MGNKTQINVKLPEEQKRRWQQAAGNDPEANGNLSQFVRLAVERQIQGDNQAEGVASDAVGDIERRLESIEEKHENFEGLIKNVAQAVDSPETHRKSRAEVYSALDKDEPKTIEEIADELADVFDELTVWDQLNGMVGEEVEKVEIDGRDHFRRA